MRVYAGICLAFVILSTQWHTIAGLPAGTRGWASGALYLAMHSTMLAAWFLDRRLASRGNRPDHAAILGVLRRPDVLLLSTGIATRFVVFSSEAFLSHDAERYLWDGAVAFAGHDPYSSRPASHQLDALRAAWATPGEHLEYPTLYPPLALAIFALCAAAGPVWASWLWRSIVLAASVAILVVVYDLLRRRNELEHFALIALSPLLLVEAQVGLHLDTLTAAAVAMGLWLLCRGFKTLASFAWLFGGALKLLPLVLVALHFITELFGAMRRRGPITSGVQSSEPSPAWLAGEKILPYVFGSMIIGGPYLTALTLGWSPVGSLGVFFEKWRFASPIWHILEPLLGAAMPGAALLGALISMALIFVRVAFARGSFWAALMAAPCVVLAFSPVVFPWYLLPVIPLLAVYRSYTVIFWTIAMPLSYEILDRFDRDGSWEPALWPVLAIIVAWSIGLSLDLGWWKPIGRGNTPVGGVAG